MFTILSVFQTCVKFVLCVACVIRMLALIILSVGGVCVWERGIYMCDGRGDVAIDRHIILSPGLIPLFTVAMFALPLT